MSDSQQINHSARRLALPVLFTFTILSLSLAGCSDSRQKAMNDAAQAQAMLDAGQIPAARQAIADAIERRDDITELHLLRGRIEVAANSPATAYSAYSDALSLDASNNEALMAVAQLGIQTGNLRESEDAADHILTLEPNQPSALLIKGLHDVMHHRNEDALKHADAILAQDSTNENGAILRARALALLGRSPEALAQIEALRKAKGDSLAIAQALLELYRQKDDAPAMITQFDVIRKHQPRDQRLVLDEANTLYKMGQTPRARAFTLALLGVPGLDERTAKLAINLWDEYDPDPLNGPALAAFAAKANEAVRKTAARYYLRHNDPDKARIVLGPDASDEDIAALVAQVAILRHDVAGGLAMANAILAKDRTNCDALIAQAQGDTIQGRFENAVSAAQLANTNCPQITSGYVALARAQIAAGDNAAADRALRAGISANIQDRWLSRTFADWLMRTGKTMQAVAIARRLTHSAPALVSGWKSYLDLCTRTDAGCADDARDGLARAQRRFAIDRRPDEALEIGLVSPLDAPDD